MEERDGIELRPAGERGAGVFACRSYAPLERVLLFRGPILPLDRVRDFSHSVQVGPDTFLGPSGGLDDYVNHSCDPNCGVRDAAGGLELVALRRIEPGEELTFDYSTTMLVEPWSLDCHCGAAACRGIVGPFPDLLPEVRGRYLRLGVVPGFLHEAIPQSGGRNPDGQID